MVDPERLEQMRSYAAEVRADLEQRELEEPIELRQAPAPTGQPPLVFKTTDNALGKMQTLHLSDQPPFDDFQIDVLAAAIAQLRQELDVTALMQRVAVLEGKVEALLTMLGADASRSVEASEVVKKIRVQR